MFGLIFGTMWLLIVFVIGVVWIDDKMNDKATTVKEEKTTETDIDKNDDFYKYDKTEEQDSRYTDDTEKAEKAYSFQLATLALLLAIIVLVFLFKN